MWLMGPENAQYQSIRVCVSSIPAAAACPQPHRVPISARPTQASRARLHSHVTGLNLLPHGHLRRRASSPPPNPQSSRHMLIHHLGSKAPFASPKVCMKRSTSASDISAWHEKRTKLRPSGAAGGTKTAPCTPREMHASLNRTVAASLSVTTEMI